MNFPAGGYDLVEFAYLPFVESIDLPSRVVENQPFPVTLHLSANLKPEILAGFLRDDGSVDDRRLDEYVDPPNGVRYLEIITWTISYSINLPKPDKVTFTVPGLPAGECTLRYDTVDSPEWGGVQILFHPLVERPWHPHATTKEYKITVDKAW